MSRVLALIPIGAAECASLNVPEIILATEKMNSSPNITFKTCVNFVKDFFRRTIRQHPAANRRIQTMDIKRTDPISPSLLTCARFMDANTVIGQLQVW